jgi:hypothetical protein
MVIGGPSFVVLPKGKAEGDPRMQPPPEARSPGAFVKNATILLSAYKRKNQGIRPVTKAPRILSIFAALECGFRPLVCEV